MGTPTWDDTKPAGSSVPTWESTTSPVISGGPVKTGQDPDWKQNRTNFKNNLPELIGTTLGGMLGATTAPLTGPFGAIGGAAAGAAAGVGVKNAAQRYGLLLGEPPKTQEDAYKSMAGGLVRGGLTEIGGQVVGKAFAPFAENITPEVRAGVEAAKRAGVSPPLATMTESPAVQAMSRISEYGPFGAPITAQRQQAVKQLENFANKITEGMGAEESAETVADKVYTRTKAYEQAFKKAKDALFEPINKTLGGKPINPENTINAIKNVLDQKAGGKEGQGLLNDWIERLSPGYEVPGMVTPQELPLFSTLKAIRTEIGSRGNFNDPGVTGIKSQLEGIYAAASTDMQNFAEQHGMADELKKANDVYSTGIRKLQGTLIDALQNNAKDPTKLDSLYNLVFKKDNTPLIKAAKEMLGDDGFSSIRKQWFDNVIKDSTRNIEGTDIVSPSLLAKNLGKFQGSMSEITADNPALAQKMGDLYETSKLLTRGLKVGQGSQTGFINKINGIVGMMTAPIVRSNLGKQYLTTGFPTAGKIAGRGVQIGTQIGLQKIGDYVGQKK